MNTLKEQISIGFNGKQKAWLDSTARSRNVKIAQIVRECVDSAMLRDRERNPYGAPASVKDDRDQLR